MKLRCSVESSIEFPVAVKEVRSGGRRSAGLPGRAIAERRRRPAETFLIDGSANSTTPRLAVHVSAAHRAALRRAGLRSAAALAVRRHGRHPEQSLPFRFSTAFRGGLRGFTLIELLTVLAIVGILATLVASAFIHFRKPSVTEAATRQMLDDCARARQLAISQRSTVYVVFIPANFWGNLNTTPWNQLPLSVRTSTIVTQMYGAQWTGYMMVAQRSVGDQPGHPVPRDLQMVKTLPDGSFISPVKFTAQSYPATPTVIGSSYLMYGFLTTNNIAFPTAGVLDNASYATTFNSIGGLTLPYIAFNSLGQLTSGDGSVLPYDEYIPLAYGTVSASRDPVSKTYVRGLPTVAEVPAGGSTGIAYNLIHVDRITGRARVERQEAL